MSKSVSVGRVVNYVANGGDGTLRVLPAVVVRVWNETCVNLQILQDGNEPNMLWRTGRYFADTTDGLRLETWHWPVIEENDGTNMTNGTNGTDVAPGGDGTGGGSPEVLGTVCFTQEQVAGVQEKLTQASGVLKKVQTLTSNGRVTLSGTAADVDQVQKMLAMVVELQTAAVKQLGLS